MDYIFLEGSRRYDFKDALAARPNGYGLINEHILSSGEVVRLNPLYSRIESTDPTKSLQMLRSHRHALLIEKLILNIDDRCIGMVGVDQSDEWPNFRRSVLKEASGRVVVTLGDVGQPIDFFTGFEDSRNNVYRPFEERRQRLTNADKFASREQMERGLAFVSEVIGKYGDPFSSELMYGREKGGHLILSDELVGRIETGKLIDD